MKLKPSEVRESPDRFPPSTPCRVRAPLGEWIGAMAFPLGLLGLRNQLVTGDIRESDQWNAQGLEGAGELKCTWAQAFVLVAKSPDNRCSIMPTQC